MNAKTSHWALTTAGILLLSCTGISCRQEERGGVPVPSTSPAQQASIPSKPPSESQNHSMALVTGISLSTEAREVSGLLDDAKYSAAEKLLENYLPQHPNDAGLYCQYVRYLVSAYDLMTDPPISSPLHRSGEDRVTTLVKDACQSAKEFEPRTSTYLTEAILKGCTSN